MSTMRLLERQAEALFTHDARGRICFVNEPGGARAPRLFVGRCEEGHLWRCRDDVPEATVRALDPLLSREPRGGDLRAEPCCLDELLAALDTARERATITSGPAYRFPEALEPLAVTRVTRSSLHLLRQLPWDLEQTARELERYEPMMAIVEDDVAVSLCHSARLTGEVAEAGVETLAAHRGRGHATAVVTAWALAVRATGRIPLYSTSWDNAASQAVARRLRLIPYGCDFSLT